MGDDFAFLLPVILGGFGIAFLAVRRADRSAGVWGLAYILNAAAFAVPGLGDIVPARAAAITADTLFALAFFLYGEALLCRFRRPPMRAVRLALLAAAIAAPAAAVSWVPALRAELVASDIGCAMQVIVALVAVGWPRRGIDRALASISWFVVGDILARTTLVDVTATNASAATYLATSYAASLQASSAITGFAFALTALAAVALDVIEDYRRQAWRDPLTGLLNRRGFDVVVAPEATGSLLYCDLDHFKRINDRFGHTTGDQVIAAVGRLLEALTPSATPVARFGGEEFVLFLSGADSGAAALFAARVRDAMARRDWTSTGLDAPPTISVGVADAAGGPHSIADALARADEGLHAAKRAGRDRMAMRLAA